MRFKTVLLDMDCVLADFVEGLGQLYGTNRETLESYQPYSQYDYCTALKLYTGKEVSTSDFWTSIESKPGFWAELPEFAWTRELIDLVKSSAHSWYVVSSPSRCPRCIPEKRQWLHRVLRTDWYDHLIPTPHKELMAKPGVVLIDDYDVNVKKFVREGGAAITFPAHHNCNHSLKQDPIPFVRSTLDYLKSHWYV